ncbi:Homeodomain-like DNA binding domain-containing transcription factor [Mucor lusitanicus CBS 277.49]|uniref:Homeodomain-like DNA binding domain-containing transcription factor n=2 Tax=Mucor circinelloides f. lusitanicus TaxID=29924 RepID=A0A168HLY3_MUCCL|nr:Homeodomain-like DNA binding domain-containing transcription factor [Mucor lusitanicus CBS 277.49]
MLNYKNTGKPCIPKKIPNKVRQKLIVEYDENGELIDSDNEQQEASAAPTASKDVQMEERHHEPQQPQQHINNSIQSNRSSRKKKKSQARHVFQNGITTRDMISYAMDQMRISESAQMNQPLPSPTTPQTMASPLSFASSSLPSMPAKLPPPSKTDQDVRGYEVWSHEDDMILLNHVLYHLHGGGWADLEVKFEGRHSARLCYDRWKHLRSLLISGITDKPNTPW